LGFLHGILCRERTIAAPLISNLMKNRNRMLRADIRAHPKIDAARFWPHPQRLIEIVRDVLK